MFIRIKELVNLAFFKILTSARREIVFFDRLTLILYFQRSITLYDAHRDYVSSIHTISLRYRICGPIW